MQQREPTSERVRMSFGSEEVSIGGVVVSSRRASCSRVELARRPGAAHDVALLAARDERRWCEFEKLDSTADFHYHAVLCFKMKLVMIWEVFAFYTEDMTYSASDAFLSILRDCCSSINSITRSTIESDWKTTFAPTQILIEGIRDLKCIFSSCIPSE